MINPPALIIAMLMIASCTTAGEPDAPQPEAPQAQTAEAWLERIETVARQTQTLQARLRWDRIQGLVDDQQRRFGRLIYVAGPPSRFAVHFHRLQLDGGRVEDQDRWWIFDGKWLVERLDDKKQFFKRQIADPRQGDADPLAEGAGPFPIPLRASKDDLLRRFNVSIVEPAEDDPENTVHLRLQPRQSQPEYSQIDLWYDRDTVLPVRARATKDRSSDEQVFELFDVQRDEPVDESLIDTRPPSERGETGWLEQVE